MFLGVLCCRSISSDFSTQRDLPPAAPGVGNEAVQVTWEWLVRVPDSCACSWQPARGVKIRARGEVSQRNLADREKTVFQTQLPLPRCPKGERSYETLPKRKWHKEKSIPRCLKAHIRPCGFYERSMFVPVFVSGKKSEEDFHFYQQRLYYADIGLL